MIRTDYHLLIGPLLVAKGKGGAAGESFSIVKISFHKFSDRSKSSFNKYVDVSGRLC